MRNRSLLLISLLLASGAVLAEQNPLEGAAKQLASDAATAAAPEAVKGAAAANQTLEGAKALTESVEKAPAAVNMQAQDSVKETLQKRIDEVTPEQAQRGADALKRGKEALKKLKTKVKNAPQSSHETTQALEGEAKERAAEKVLELLR